MIYEKPKNEIFASDAKDGEIVDFPNIKRGWGVTENLGFIPPMEYFNAAFNRIDKSMAYQLQRGVGEWDKDLEYPIGAVVSLNEVVYVAKSQNINKNPANEATTWDIVATQKWCEDSFFKKTDKIDAYTKKESDEKFALKDDLPPLATETKVGITKLKNIINAKQTDVAVTEKAVSDAIEAMKNSVAGTAKLSTNGYIKLPSGLILQWMRAISGGTQLFPITFPNECFFVSATHTAQQGSTEAVGLVSTKSFSNSRATFWSSQSGSGAMISGQCLLIFAIGW